MLLPYLQEFIKTHPHIKITIECQSTNHTLQLLKENKIDVGLIGEPERLIMYILTVLVKSKIFL